MLNFKNEKINQADFITATTTKNGKQKIIAFAKSVKLNNNGKQIVKKLLHLQKIALDNNFINLLTIINKKLFAINEYYRRRIVKNAQKVEISFQGCKTFEFITCYSLVQ